MLYNHFTEKLLGLQGVIITNIEITRGGTIMKKSLFDQKGGTYGYECFFILYISISIISRTINAAVLHVCNRNQNFLY